METAAVPELPPAPEEARLAGNPSRELRELIALYNSRLEAACTVVQRFLKRDAFIISHQRWLAENPKSTRVPVIKSMVKQAEAQQKQVREQEASMLLAIGDLLMALYDSVEFQRLRHFGVYRYGALRLPNGLKLDGESVDLWTIEHCDPSAASEKPGAAAPEPKTA